PEAHPVEECEDRLPTLVPMQHVGAHRRKCLSAADWRDEEYEMIQERQQYDRYAVRVSDVSDRSGHSLQPSNEETTQDPEKHSQRSSCWPEDLYFPTHRRRRARPQRSYRYPG